MNTDIYNLLKNIYRFYVMKYANMGRGKIVSVYYNFLLSEMLIHYLAALIKQRLNNENIKYGSFFTTASSYYLPKFTIFGKYVRLSVCLSVCLSVSLSVLSSITHERCDISSPNLVHIWNGWAVPVCDIDK